MFNIEKRSINHEFFHSKGFDFSFFPNSVSRDATNEPLKKLKKNKEELQKKNFLKKQF
jgi:hypothetical protein